MGHQDSFHGMHHPSIRSCVRKRSPICLHRQTQSRREVRYRHTFDAALTIYRTEGLRAFYRGLLPSLFGITHVAVQFPLYEKLKVWARASCFLLS